MENISLKEVQAAVHKFVQERNWETPPEDIVVHMLEEFGEVARNVLKLKNYGGKHTNKDPINMEEELADVLYCLVKLANATNVDISQAFVDKMEKNRQRFPVKN